MFENIINFFKRIAKKEKNVSNNSKDTAKERLHLVLMQDRANVSADFLELMKQEIIDVIKKYIDIDEGSIDVRLTNKENEDGTNGAPALYANIPILNIKNDARKVESKENKKDDSKKESAKKSEEIQEKDKKESDNSEKEKTVKEVEKEIKSKEQENKEEKSTEIVIDTKEEQEELKESEEKTKNEEKKENKV